MSAAMMRKAARDLRWTILAYSLGLAAYALIMVLFFPSVGKMHLELDKTLPEALRKAFGITDYSTLTGFLGAEYLNVMWPLIASVFLIMAGSATVAQELERGTIDLWLSIPLSRRRLLAAKVAVLYASIIVLALITIITLWVGAFLIGESLELDHLLLLGLVMALFSSAVASASVLLSTLVRSRGVAAGAGAAIVVGSYLTWVVAGLSPDWGWMRHITLFSAYKAQAALAQGTADWLSLAILALVSAACVIGAVEVFKRRDVIA